MTKAEQNLTKEFQKLIDEAYEKGLKDGEQRLIRSIIKDGILDNVKDGE